MSKAQQVTEEQKEKIERLCLKKCIRELNTLELNAGEISCIGRCSFKFMESLDFSYKALLNNEWKLWEANEEFLKLQNK
jgi:Tim10/DDP family zinc finger